MASTVELARKKFLEHHDRLREQKRKIVVLDTLPAPPPVVVTQAATCKARTMKGTKCNFKAVKGGFCSRHCSK